MTQEEEEYYVELGMRTYGGNFVKALGLALSKADPSNTEKIKNAFPEYYKKYLEMGKDLFIKRKERYDNYMANPNLIKQ